MMNGTAKMLLPYQFAFPCTCNASWMYDVNFDELQDCNDVFAALVCSCYGLLS